MTGKKTVRETETVSSALDSCTEWDFDGHSLFHTFTHSQRLEWLEMAREDLLELKALSQMKRAQGGMVRARPSR